MLRKKRKTLKPTIALKESPRKYLRPFALRLKPDRRSCPSGRYHESQNQNVTAHLEKIKRSVFCVSFLHRKKKGVD